MFCAPGQEGGIKRPAGYRVVHGNWVWDNVPSGSHGMTPIDAYWGMSSSDAFE